MPCCARRWRQGGFNGDDDALNYRATDVAPRAVLRAMMDQQFLTQNELAQEPASQGVVSEIFSGKREMNLRQLRALAIRFSVPGTAFVGGASVAAAVP